ncbi:hypothetical protein BGZ83_000471 [Gryganskiella cystojenkinii]|nr:hypothetical protein BGZ83_000471 [Gryganskiella cystojenkinii]
MVAAHKEATKGKKLGWEILKLQAQVGETDSRKAKKAVEADYKKKGIVLPKKTHNKRRSKKNKGGSSDEDSEDSEDEEAKEEEAKVEQELSEAAKEAAEKLWKLKEIKISQKVYHAKKEIKKAFVKAKSFENQRLSKRLRLAKAAVEKKESKPEETTTEEGSKPVLKKGQDFSPEDIVKFENELDLLKKMDMDALSEHAFAAKLAKHPILGSHGLMAPYVQPKNSKKDKDSSLTESTADEKSSTQKESLTQIIEARLTNTKTVKEHMSKLWDELEHIVTGKKPDHEELCKKRKSRNAAGDDPSNNSDGEEGQQSKSKKAKTGKDTKNNKNAAKDESEDGDGDSGSEDEAMGYSSGSDDDQENDGYDSDGMPLPMNAGPASSGSSMFIGSLNAGNSKKDKKDRKGKKKDKNNWVDEKFDEIYGKVKKNRPGQRARREKAERKFGQEANHVKKALEEAKIREERKAARKAKQEKFKAKDASSANSQKLPSKRIIGAGDGSAAIRQPVPPKAKRVPSGPDLNDPTLHPSWIAKQTEKAAMAAALSGAKSNKITFDDSD